MQKLDEIHEIKVKEERGITLLALTITVLVILIISGIAIISLNRG